MDGGGLLGRGAVRMRRSSEVGEERFSLILLIISSNIDYLVCDRSIDRPTALSVLLPRTLATRTQTKLHDPLLTFVKGERSREKDTGLVGSVGKAGQLLFYLSFNQRNQLPTSSAKGLHGSRPTD